MYISSSFKKINLKTSSEKWRQFCLCLNMLTMLPPRGRISTTGGISRLRHDRNCEYIVGAVSTARQGYVIVSVSWLIEEMTHSYLLAFPVGEMVWLRSWYRAVIFWKERVDVNTCGLNNSLKLQFTSLGVINGSGICCPSGLFVELLLIGLLGTNFNEFWIKALNFPFGIMHF